MKTSACNILDILANLRISSVCEEYDIHALIADALAAGGIAFEHEYKLAPHKRAYFFCNGTVIEVKKGKPARSMLIKQISGYLQCSETVDMIVVTQRHIPLPAAIAGKPVYQLALDRLWGVALP